MRAQYALLVLAFVLIESAMLFQNFDFHDLAAMYCGGRILADGGDPYLTEPLRTCEEGLRTVPPLRPNRLVVVVPAPQPAYGLRVFALGRFPFHVTLAIYLIALPFAFLAAARASAALTGEPPWIAGAILLPAMTYGSIPVGQPTPFVIAAIACAAAAFERRDESRGTLLALPALIHPQLGLAVFGTIFVLYPKLWKIALLIVLVVGGVQLATAGLERTLAYLTVILPHQAQAEVYNHGQVSVTAVAAILGAQPGAALLAGSLAYACGLLLSPLVAARLRERSGSGAATILVPAAFGCLGSYIHLSQIGCAVPLALFLAARAPWSRNLFALLLACVAIPWQNLFTQERFPFAIAVALACVAAIGAMQGFSRRAIGVCLAITLASIALFGTILPASSGGVRDCPQAQPAQLLASDTWHAVSDCFLSNTSPGYRLVRAPTWFGLFGLVLGASLLAFRDGKARRRTAAAPAG